MKVASLFSGAGGLDLGFTQAGFNIVWANEYDSSIWETHRANFPETHLDTRSIVKIEPNDIPDVIGMIGGPPCQSWSEAGTQRGIKDARGQLFLDYVRLLSEKQPLFFLAENVSGMLHHKHKQALENILQAFDQANYSVEYRLLNAYDYEVPQDRKRLIFVGFRKDLGKKFIFPSSIPKKLCLKDAIFDLHTKEVAALEKNRTNPAMSIANHEYMIGGFSSIFMSRNRVRMWNEPSFTIQAGGRHAPLHPQAPKMQYVAKDKFAFAVESENQYRRLSVRECARIQTFPDNFIFHYQMVADGYKMIGNAVPVRFAYHLASAIKAQLEDKKDTYMQLSHSPETLWNAEVVQNVFWF